MLMMVCVASCMNYTVWSSTSRVIFASPLCVALACHVLIFFYFAMLDIFRSFLSVITTGFSLLLSLFVFHQTTVENSGW